MLLGISLISFVLLQLTPGDPVRRLLGPKASKEAIALVRERYGLERLVLVQNLSCLRNLLGGDFGQSITFRGPIGPVLLDQIAPTLFLLVYGLTLSVALTLGLGVLAARSRGAWPDQGIRLICVLGGSVPSYFVRLLLVMAVGNVGANLLIDVVVAALDPRIGT